MYSKITNPETGRKVNINSKLGTEIIKKYILQNGGNIFRTSSFTLPKISTDSFKVLRAIKQSFYDKIEQKISNVSPLNDYTFMKFVNKSQKFLLSEKRFFIDQMRTESIDLSQVIDISLSAKHMTFRIVSYILLIAMNMNINLIDKKGNQYLINTPLETFTELDLYSMDKVNLNILDSSYQYSLYASRIYDINKINPGDEENHLTLIIYNDDHSKQNQIIIGDGEYTPFYALYLDHNLKSIIIVIRGTSDTKDAIIDILCDTVDVSFKSENSIDPDINCFVHEGFYRASVIIIKALKQIILSYMRNYEDYDVVVTGHSLGGGTSIITGILLYTDQLFKGNGNYFVVDGKIRNLKVKAYAPGSTFTQDLDEIQAGNDPLHKFLKKNTNIDIISYVYYSDVVPRASAYSMINFFIIAQILRYLLIEGKSIPNFLVSQKGLFKKNLTIAFFEHLLTSKTIHTNSSTIRKIEDLIQYITMVIDKSSDKVREFYLKHDKYNKLRTLIPGNVFLLVPPEKNTDYLRYHIQRIKSNELSQPILFVSDKCLDNHHMENYSAALKALSKNNDCYPCSHKYELAML